MFQMEIQSKILLSNSVAAYTNDANVTQLLF